MEENKLDLVYHYRDINQPERALSILEQQPLNMENAEHFDYFIILTELLFVLERDLEARDIADQLRAKYPDDELSIHNWIWVSRNYPERVKDAYELAAYTFAQFPNKEFYPYAMAWMCFSYQVDSDQKMLAHLRTALKLNRNMDTLSMAQLIYQRLKMFDEEQVCLEELIAEYPDNEVSKEALSDSLHQQKKYRESLHVALDAIRSYPSNQQILSILTKTENKLFGRYYNQWPLEQLEKLSDYMDQRRLSLGFAGAVKNKLLAVVVMLAIVVSVVSVIVLFPLTLVVDALLRNERMAIKRSQDSDFGQLNAGSDCISACGDGVVVWNPEANTGYKFIYLGLNEVVFAKNILAPIDEFQFALDHSYLKKPKNIASAKIQEINFTNTQIEIKIKGSNSFNVMELSNVSTVVHLQESVKDFGYQLTKNRQSSRLVSIIITLLWLLIPLGLWNNYSEQPVYIIYIEMLFVINAFSYLIHRLRHPIKKWQFKKTESN